MPSPTMNDAAPITTRAPGTHHRPRRPRAARACDVCRAKKYKCDEQFPCSYCRGRNVECVYRGQDTSRRITSSYIQQLEDQVKNLSSRVETYENSAMDYDRLSGNSNSNLENPSVVQHPPAPLPAASAPIAAETSFPNFQVHAQPPNPQHPSSSAARETIPTPNSTSPWHGRDQEISGTNTHTRDVQFYGSSSSVALLSHVQRTGVRGEGELGNREDDDDEIDDEGDILSTLHNPAFNNTRSGSENEPQGRDRGGTHNGDDDNDNNNGTSTNHQRRLNPPLTNPIGNPTRPSQTHASSTIQPPSSSPHPSHRRYLDTYFSTIHYIHPILNKRSFLDRCETLWSKGNHTTVNASTNANTAHENEAESHDKRAQTKDDRTTSFTVLYFAVMSLGAIVGGPIESSRDSSPTSSSFPTTSSTDQRYTSRNSSNRDNDTNAPVYNDNVDDASETGNATRKGGGRSNITYSRQFFALAKNACTALGLVTDLNMVQGYFFMAKVCQNELHPHLSYMYIGLAIRTALAMGINRAPSPGDNSNEAAFIRRAEEGRTWWGLYSLEIEMSFAMGRPDTLGYDEYHTQPFPLISSSSDPQYSNPSLPSSSTPPNSNLQSINNSDVNPSKLFDPPYCSIIAQMVHFSKIVRRICLTMYLPPENELAITNMVSAAEQIEEQLEAWVDELPEGLRAEGIGCQEGARRGSARSRRGDMGVSLKGVRDKVWVRRQRVVLGLRYHNIRILLFGALLLRSSPEQRAAVPEARRCVEKAIQSARETIETIWRVYRWGEWFWTWFYNTTYTVFAASILLLYIVQEEPAESGFDHDHESLSYNDVLRLIDMAIEILLVMDECVVAVKAAGLLKRARERVGKRKNEQDRQRQKQRQREERGEVGVSTSTPGTTDTDMTGHIATSANTTTITAPVMGVELGTAVRHVRSDMMPRERDFSAQPFDPLWTEELSIGMGIGGYLNSYWGPLGLLDIDFDANEDVYMDVDGGSGFVGGSGGGFGGWA